MIKLEDMTTQRLLALFKKTRGRYYANENYMPEYALAQKALMDRIREILKCRGHCPRKRRQTVQLEGKLGDNLRR